MTLQTFQGFYILPKEFLALNRINRATHHNRIFIGKEYNKQYFFWIESVRLKLNLTLEFTNWQEMKDIRDFFFLLKGRYGNFWCPSFINDILILNTGTITNKLYIKKSLYDTNKTIHRPIVIHIPEYNKVTYVTQINSEYDDITGEQLEVFTLNDSLDITVDDPNKCLNICQLFLGRFDTDIGRFYFDELVRGKIQLNFMELSNSDYARKVPDLYNAIY